MLKTIKIREDTHKELLKIGHKGESFDQLFKRLIVNYKKHKKG